MVDQPRPHHRPSDVDGAPGFYVCHSDGEPWPCEWGALVEKVTKAAGDYITAHGFIGTLQPAIEVALETAWPQICAMLADEVTRLAPYNVELRPDGREDPLTASWVEGIKDAAEALRQGRERAQDPRPRAVCPVCGRSVTVYLPGPHTAVITPHFDTRGEHVESCPGDGSIVSQGAIEWPEGEPR